MMNRTKMIVAGFILAVFVFNNTGCAAAWFLAGAGTAATAIVVSEEARKNSTEPEPDK